MDIDKVGILTFNRAINYGAVLQAYALKSVLAPRLNVEIINYVSPSIEKLYKPFSGSKIKGIVRFITFNSRDKKFKRFIGEMSSSKLYCKTDAALLPYQKIIVGSDQVFNYTCSGGDEFFLLPDYNGKKYAYAASFGISELPVGQVEYFKTQLQKFKYLSVRERSGANICNKQLNLSAEVVLDPTLLLTKTEWASGRNLKESNKKYVLLFTLENNENLKRVAKKISKQLKIPVYNVAYSVKDFFGNKVIKNAGPDDWLSLVYNAAFVVTDSFHGTAFSVNFNKQFYSYAKNNRASRIVDLLNMLGLKNRLNVPYEELDANEIINYNSVNGALNEERAKSKLFIEKIVND